MREHLQQVKDPGGSFSLLAKAADISDQNSGQQRLCLQAKAAMLRDRAEAAREADFFVKSVQLLHPELQAFGKADVLVGYPYKQ
jgi:hypothetical protein